MSTSDTELRLARRVLYRFASLALADPRSGSWGPLRDPQTRELAVAAAARLREEAAARPPAPARHERPLDDLDPAAVLDHLPASVEALEEEYLRVFGPLARGPCPAHETDYLGGRFDFQGAHALADVSGYYRAFGLRPSARRPERHDHVTLELEFLALLLDLEDRALEAGEADRAAVCRDAQRRFLGEHVAWWVPAFARLVAHEAGGGFHGALAPFLGALVAAERGLLGVAAPERTAEPASAEPSGECDGCFAQP